MATARAYAIVRRVASRPTLRAASTAGVETALKSHAETPTKPSRQREFLRIAASLLLGFASILVASTPASANSPTVTREWGANRYATAVAVSQANFPAPGVPVVYVATGTGFPDALAAGAAAAKLGGPLLLVQPNAIPGETAVELDRLDPSKIVIAGGTSAVSALVATNLGQYASTVTREWGGNRYATSAAIALTNFASGVNVAYVATGTNFPDALAAGPATAKHGGPVLLVTGTSIPAETADALGRLNPDRIVVAGGTSVVSVGVATQLAAYAPVSRQAGANRYATAANISAANFATNVPVVFVATGTNFPDALAAGPAAAKGGGPILLVQPGFVPTETAAEIRRLNPDHIVIVGGTGTVSAATANALVRLTLKPTGPTQTGTVTRVIDSDTIEVNIGGVIYDVRYTGIDTPEIHSGVEWLGPEASSANAALVAGKQVVLEKDVSETDQYGRLLRYVWVQSGSSWLLVNLELLRMGYATVTTYPPDVKYVDWVFLPAQQEAQAANVGLWGSEPPPPPPPSGCHASYPDFCIPPPPPDLDCGDLTQKNFTVLAPDPHGFDGNNDGVGCQT